FICVGVGFQILQLGDSIWQRCQNLDTSGDPWDGRTLEWSTASPAPFYNFAHIPQVTSRDEFWVAKQAQKTSKSPMPPHKYVDIILPKNTCAGMVIAGFAFLFGFAVVWHILWLGVIGMLGVITAIIIRMNNDETEYVVPASEVKAIEDARRKQYA
ncbi:MAG: cytochrome o ubiquinol oxidase subunit I, partial [Candidatus Saccharibacteria bacterium]